MIILQLLWSFFQIGLFSIGGGYAALPLIQEQVVDFNHWLNMTEFVDIITISQMTPGPIAINAATFVGIRIAGIWGAVAATLGCILPSCIIVLLLAYLYYKYRELTHNKRNPVRPAPCRRFLDRSSWNVDHHLDFLGRKARILSSAGYRFYRGRYFCNFPVHPAQMEMQSYLRYAWRWYNRNGAIPIYITRFYSKNFVQTRALLVKFFDICVSIIIYFLLFLWDLSRKILPYKISHAPQRIYARRIASLFGGYTGEVL